MPTNLETHRCDAKDSHSTIAVHPNAKTVTTTSAAAAAAAVAAAAVAAVDRRR